MGTFHGYNPLHAVWLIFSLVCIFLSSSYYSCVAMPCNWCTDIVTSLALLSRSPQLFMVLPCIVSRTTLNQHADTQGHRTSHNSRVTQTNTHASKVQHCTRCTHPVQSCNSPTHDTAALPFYVTLNTVPREHTT